jgi:hypothetical protein
MGVVLLCALVFCWYRFGVSACGVLVWSGNRGSPIIAVWARCYSFIRIVVDEDVCAIDVLLEVYLLKFRRCCECVISDLLSSGDD